MAKRSVTRTPPFDTTTRLPFANVSMIMIARADDIDGLQIGWMLPAWRICSPRR
ncbi:hypothetical protein [Thiothrix lacustris]|uniref:hypothetical protein n=1 Tax=Thiothrix lacustris TaxID=525917 RepID=UPI0027E4D7FB|nr:hypothetical protein [Thiothrix lacustris]WMP17492.1 hypothetical protein RCS87_19245 [Thiothrix lacustris]